MAGKNIFIIIVFLLSIKIHSESLAVVFSGSNNGYFRDCG